MAQIVPTITAENPHIYREQIERVEKFAKRIHIDLMDGVFTPNQSLDIDQVWLPKGIISDVHVMFAEPEAIINDLIRLEPSLIIIPAEASFDLKNISHLLNSASIKLGIALLPETSVESLGSAINEISHLLVFSGNLGHQGGSTANLDLLAKATKAQELNPKLEIGWDGGVDATNVMVIANEGIQTINTGGFIHGAQDAEDAYKTLSNLIQSS